MCVNADFEQNYVGGVYVDKVGVKPRLGLCLGLGSGSWV